MRAARFTLLLDERIAIPTLVEVIGSQLISSVSAAVVTAFMLSRFNRSCESAGISFARMSISRR